MIVNLISAAFAQSEVAGQLPATPPANPEPGGSLFVLMMMIMGIMYFMVLKPQNKAQKEHKSLLAGLKKGDRIVTDGGIMGLIHQVEEDRVVVEVGDRVRIPFLKDSVKALYSTADAGKE